MPRGLDLPIEYIFELAPIGFVLYEPFIVNDEVRDAVIRWVNPKAAAMIGFAQSDLLGMHAEALYGAVDWEEQRLRMTRLIRTDEAFTYERTHYQDGKPFDYQGIAWWAPPWIAIVVRDVHGETMRFLEAEDVQAGLRLAARRSEQVLRLVSALEEVQHQRGD